MVADVSLLASFVSKSKEKTEIKTPQLKISSQQPCCPSWKVGSEKWTSVSIFKVALCVFKRWPVSEGSWLWLRNAAALHLLPTGDCKASVNTKILSLLLSLYLLTCLHSLSTLIYIQSSTHTYTHIPHTPCQHAPVTPSASLYMEHMLGNVTALAANGSGTLQ